MTTKRPDPIVVTVTVEANPSEETVEIDRAEWDAKTPVERSALLQDLVDTAIANAGGAGWHIESGATDDEVA